MREAAAECVSLLDKTLPSMFENFFGNRIVVDALEQTIQRDRIPQTLLFDGPEGVGKATLARRLAAQLLGGAALIEKDDLSLPENQAVLADREKWASDKRAEDPLLFGSHPDFLTFPPDGPLRQISIQQMRLLRERAQLKPLRGRWRVFLIDQLDRAGEHAANSLLKTLEEPPDHLILVLTAQNLYDLLPTIRSRAVPLHFVRLPEAAMREFIRARGLDQPERRLALAQGSPGRALSLDLDAYDQRRGAMLKLLQVAAGRAPFAEWMKYSESISARKSERLDFYLEVLYVLLGDLLLLQHNQDGIRNIDIRRELEGLAARVSFDWVRTAVAKVDELVSLLRRNIQKGIALDALALELRSR